MTPTLARRRFFALAPLALVAACSPRPPADPAPGAPAAPATPAPTPPVTTVPVAADLAAPGRTPVAWGTHLPGIRDVVDGGVALTFDACGGPSGSGVDHALLDLLRAEAIPATLFLNERWVRAHEQLTAELAADPLFQIENHGSRHLPLSVDGRAAYGIAGTTSYADARAEIESNQRTLTDVAGRTPRWFRAGTAHYDDVAVDLLTDLGLGVAGFAVNGDAGATANPAAVEHALAGARDGAIVLAHMNQPHGGTASGLARALPALRAAGTTFRLLGEP